MCILQQLAIDPFACIMYMLSTGLAIVFVYTHLQCCQSVGFYPQTTDFAKTYFSGRTDNDKRTRKYGFLGTHARNT